MRILLVHTENCFFAGAQKVLGYFLDEVTQMNCHVALAMTPNSKLSRIIPKGVLHCQLSSNQPFALGGFRSQIRELMRFQRSFSANVIHGWTARDWELTAIASMLTGRPGAGTLHDHPRASFISSKRQKLMRATAQFGLQQLVCVSDAVKQVCQESGYSSRKLNVIRNGLPGNSPWPPRQEREFVRLGYLGAFSERKGFRGLFEILENLGQNSRLDWEISLAGAMQAPGNLVADVEAKFGQAHWWKRVKWNGWTDQPLDFLNSIDLLICPSSEFDPLPTVLLEAGKIGIPALATRVGGVSEIIRDGETGWLFEVGNWKGAAEKVEQLIGNRQLIRNAGNAARARIATEFSARGMASEYLNLFESLN